MRETLRRYLEYCLAMGVMNPKNARSQVVIGLLFSLLLWIAANSSSASQPVLHSIPYRVLLVVDRWDDPYGVVVNISQDKFQPIAALLKAWSIPFDILRLDQQRLDASYLFDRTGNIRYGAVVWLTDSDSYIEQELGSLEQATNAGTGLIAINSRVLDPVLNKLLGLEFKQHYTSTESLRLASDHYIVRGITKNSMPSQDREYSDRL